MRAVAEWIGKTDDTPIPERVKIRIWLREGGRCYLTGKQIRPGDKYQFEHVIAICNGGENRENNIRLALTEGHKPKTKRDRAIKKKSDKIIKRHAGFGGPKRKIPYRLFDGTPVDPNKHPARG